MTSLAARMPSLRSLIGAAILATTVGIVGAQSVISYRVEAQVHVVGFVRAERADESLDRVVADVREVMRAHPGATVQVVGHTEPGPDEDADMGLSRRRAERVRDLIVASGVDGTRVVAVGVGGSRPPERREGESDAAFQRRMARVEVRVER